MRLSIKAAVVCGRVFLLPAFILAGCLFDSGKSADSNPCPEGIYSGILDNQYDGHDSLIHSELRNAQGKVQQSFNLEYLNLKLIKSDWLDSAGRLVSHTEFLYDQAGRVEKRGSDISGNLCMVNRYSADGKTVIFKSCANDSSGFSIGYYDENGRIFRTDQFDKDSILQDQYISEFDSIAKERKSYSIEKGIKTLLYLEMFNDSGKTIETRLTYGSEGLYTAVKYEYAGRLSMKNPTIQLGRMFSCG